MKTDPEMRNTFEPLSKSSLHSMQKNVAIESPHNYNLKFYVEKVHKMEML